MNRIERQTAFDELLGRLAAYGMDLFFCMLLTVSRSRRQLVSFHGDDSLVPANCRLLRDDLTTLELAFELKFPEVEQPRMGIGFDLGFARAMLAQARANYRTDVVGLVRIPDRNLTGYYCDRLISREGVVSARYDHTHMRVYPHPAKGPHPDFTTELSGRVCDTEIRLSSDRTRLVVTFNVWERDLTEPWTHGLLQLPPWHASLTSSSSDRGRLIDITYVVEDVEIIGLLDQVHERPRHHEPILYVANSAFLIALGNKLRDQGVAIGPIFPVVELVDGQPSDWIDFGEWDLADFIITFGPNTPRILNGFGKVGNIEWTDEGMVAYTSLAVRHGCMDLKAVTEMLLAHLFAQNPRLAREDVLSVGERGIPKRARSLKTEALMFVSSEGICLGRPHPSIPRDERGRLIWPTLPETPTVPEAPVAPDA